LKAEFSESPPPLWLQLLSLWAIFAIGIAAGWVVWGRNAGTARNAPQEPAQRRVVLGTANGTSAETPAPAPPVSSPALDRIFRALTIVDPDTRFVEFIGALGEMKSQDAPHVRQRLADDFQPEKVASREKDAFFRQWGAVDPQGAIAYAKTQADEKAQGWVLKTMIEGWARKDHAAAAHWLDGWPTAPDWEGICTGLIKGIASKDPWMATQTAIASFPEQAQWHREAMVTYLADAMERRGGNDELKRWFESIPGATPVERKWKQKAMHEVALRLEHRDLTAAKQWLVAQPAEPWRSSAAYALVAKKLAATDRAAALSWLASIPAGTATVGREAGKEIFRDWVAEKPDNAARWAGTVTDQKFLIDIGALKKAPVEHRTK
jgi:hypothetical protein